MQTFEYNRTFRLKLIALCLDDKWIAKYGIIIKPEFFERSDEEGLARTILEHRAKFGHAPDSSDALASLGDEYKKIISTVYRGIDNWDFDFASDVAIQFAKEQAAKLAILDSVDDINNGNIGAAIDRMKQALAVGEHIESVGIDPIADVDNWLYEYWTDKVRTGWTHVDSLLEGGLSPGEEGIIMAPQNRGKSMALVNIGYGAATIGSGKNVVHFSHEMRESQVAKRYASRIVFRFPKQDEDLDKYSEKLVLAARRLLVGKIRIINDGSTSIVKIRSRIDRLADEGFIPGLIIDDYPDLVHPARNYKDVRFGISEVYNAFRELAGDLGVPLWGASQSRRTSHSKEIITIDDIAEDIGKASIADVIISLCQSKEEADSDQCRLFMAKVRDGRGHKTVAAKYMGLQQAIITTGIITGKERNPTVV